MGIFWESKKEKEMEARALEALLRQFEQDNTLSSRKPSDGISDAANQPLKQTELKKVSASMPMANVHDLARFLADKNIISFSDWETYIINKKK